MARFVNARVAEVVQPFWAALQAGEFIADAAVAAGTYRKQGTRWVAACGGVRPRRGRDLQGRCLSFAEREEIALARARGDDPRDRAPAGTVAVDDLTRAAPQRRPLRWLPSDDRA
jgi:transposase, IS30 family